MFPAIYDIFLLSRYQDPQINPPIPYLFEEKHFIMSIFNVFPKRRGRVIKCNLISALPPFLYKRCLIYVKAFFIFLFIFFLYTFYNCFHISRKIFYIYNIIIYSLLSIIAFQCFLFKTFKFSICISLCHILKISYLRNLSS